MFHGRRYQSFYLHLVLIATAIQGATPDAHDLASLNSLRILYPALSDTGTGPTEDGLPDDVCAPTTPEMQRLLRTRIGADALAVLDLTSTAIDALLVQASTRRPTRGRSHNIPIGNLLRSLCRLKC